MKIVIHANYGEFSLIPKIETALKNRGWTDDQISTVFDPSSPLRTDEALVSVVEYFKEQGKPTGDLKVLTIPDDTVWRIIDKDGWEAVVDRRYFWY